ncbi:MAG: hypothetical protein ABIP97_00525, partial [Chthoniobacterales bacterium]
MSQTPNAAPSSRKKFIRWPFILLAILLVIFPFSLWMTLQHLTKITNWTVSRFAPNPHIRFENVTLENFQTTHIGKIAIYSTDKTKVLIEARDVTVTASITDLVKNHFRNVDIAELTINISEEFQDAFKSPKKSDNNSVWTIDHLKCDYGVLDVQESGQDAIHLNTKFLLDLKNLGSESSIFKNSHSITLWDGKVNLGPDDPFLTLDLLNVAFSLDQLKVKYLRQIDVTGGTFVFGNSLRHKALEKQTTATANSAPSPWMLGQLSVKNVNTKITDLGASVPDIQFTIQTPQPLYNLSASAAEDELSTT